MTNIQIKHPNNQTYSAGIISQSFWFVEFKKYLNLLLQGYTPAQIKDMVIQENIFASPNPSRARRIFGYISSRATNIDKEGIDLFFSSDLTTQKLLNLICIIRKDRLFFEFINEVYREKVILGANTLEISDANVFFRNKEVQSDIVAGWADGTKKRMRSCYFNFLADANLLTITDKKKIITPAILDMSLEHYLKANGEVSIIKAITGGVLR